MFYLHLRLSIGGVQGAKERDPWGALDGQCINYNGRGVLIYCTL